MAGTASLSSSSRGGSVGLRSTVFGFAQVDLLLWVVALFGECELEWMGFRYILGLKSVLGLEFSLDTVARSLPPETDRIDQDLKPAEARPRWRELLTVDHFLNSEASEDLDSFTPPDDPDVDCSEVPKPDVSREVVTNEVVSSTDQLDVVCDT